MTFANVASPRAFSFTPTPGGRAAGGPAAPAPRQPMGCDTFKRTSVPGAVEAKDFKGHALTPKTPTAGTEGHPVELKGFKGHAFDGVFPHLGGSIEHQLGEISAFGGGR